MKARCRINPAFFYVAGRESGLNTLLAGSVCVLLGIQPSLGLFATIIATSVAAAVIYARLVAGLRFIERK